jgi:hypothetical protein
LPTGLQFQTRADPGHSVRERKDDFRPDAYIYNRRLILPQAKTYADWTAPGKVQS